MTNLVDLKRATQAALVARGYDLGDTGPARDGVDGVDGVMTWTALLDAVGRIAIETPPLLSGLTDEKAFFDNLRESGLFPNGLTKSQVEGIKFKLAAMTAASWPLSWASAGFGTAYHETGAKMIPVRERGSGDGPDADPWDDYLERYDTGRLAARLGNTPEADGDGVKYAGMGDVQVTGTDNYRKMGQALGLDLLAEPELMLRPDVSAKAMILGMERGMFTGKSLPGVLGKGLGRRSRPDYIRTRPIINGTDRAEQIADIILKWEDALVDGGWR